MSPPDLSFIHWKHVRFLPQDRDPAPELNFTVRSTTLSQDMNVWVVHNARGQLSQAGIPALDATQVGPSLVLRLYPFENGEQVRNADLQNLAVLQRVLRPFNGAVVAPSFVVPGIVYVRREMEIPALLMAAVDGTSVQSLPGGGPYSRGVLARAAGSLQQLGSALHRQGMTLGYISASNVMLEYARLRPEDDGWGPRALSGRVVLTNWTDLRDRTTNTQT
ncbi:hypothetical protein FA95DRAFT_1610419, partial [Auriscalpium vulgare]